MGHPGGGERGRSTLVIVSDSVNHSLIIFIYFLNHFNVKYKIADIVRTQNNIYKT